MMHQFFDLLISVDDWFTGYFSSVSTLDRAFFPLLSLIVWSLVFRVYSLEFISFLFAFKSTFVFSSF